MKNSLIIQSGGPTSVINSTLHGIVKELKKQNIGEIYGAKHGVLGLINNDLINLTDISETNLNLLKQTPGAILGSSRHKLNDSYNSEEYKAIKENIINNNIGYIFINGGNDSMDTGDKLNKFLIKNNLDCKILGVPKTIDNDLINIDHTPGYGSALKYIANTISCIHQDIKCYAKGKVTIVEIMGRDTGWLTAGSLLAGDNKPDLIYLPEGEFSLEAFLKDIEKVYNEKRYALVCISEGVELNDDTSYKIDNFGHKQLGGLASRLEKIVDNELHIPTRSIELNLMQRCSTFINSKCDVTEAIKCGSFAVKSILKGETGKMVTMIRTSDYKIKYDLTPLAPIANSIKYFPKEWIINNNYISDKFKEYALPLIQGENKIEYSNGIIKFSNINK